MNPHEQTPPPSAGAPCPLRETPEDPRVDPAGNAPSRPTARRRPWGYFLFMITPALVFTLTIALDSESRRKQDVGSALETLLYGLAAVFIVAIVCASWTAHLRISTWPPVIVWLGTFALTVPR
jgi:hypothetical protein